MASPTATRTPANDPLRTTIHMATRDARRAGLAVALFSLWLVLTTIGQDMDPARTFGWQGFLLLVTGYSVLSIMSLVSLVHGGATVLTDPVARSSVSRRLMPFWLLVASATVCGVSIGKLASTSPLEGAWLGMSTALAGMLAPTALALVLEVRTMRTLPTLQKSTMLK